MKSFCFSGMTTLTARSDFNATVTLEDVILAYVDGQTEFTVEDVEAWTDEEHHQQWLKERMLADVNEEGE